jgi:hypothetical protein
MLFKRTGRIGIHKGDDPREVAINFAKIYALNENMTETLVNLLENYID